MKEKEKEVLIFAIPSLETDEDVTRTRHEDTVLCPKSSNSGGVEDAHLEENQTARYTLESPPCGFPSCILFGRATRVKVSDARFPTLLLLRLLCKRRIAK